MRTRKKLGMWVAASMASCLVACGGGGGGGDGGGGGGGGGEGGAGGGGSVESLQGGYSAVANNGTSGSAVILEDGSVWSIGGVESGGVLLIHSLIQGTVNLSGASATSNNLRVYDFESRTTTEAAFSGTLASSGVISGSVTASGTNPVSVALTPAASADFDYDMPATLSAIAGTWTGGFSTDDSGSISISSGGTISSVTDIGCTITGSVTPRPSGKNVYNVSVAFGPAPCALPNGSATGIAVIIGSGDEERLTVGVTTADRSLGAAFVGSR